MNLNPFLSGDKTFHAQIQITFRAAYFQTCSSWLFFAASLIAVTDNKSHLTLTQFPRNASELNKQQLPRCGYLSQQCATRDSELESFLLFLFFARGVINFHRQTNTFCSTDETENFCVLFNHTAFVLRRVDDQTQHWTNTRETVLARKKTENWLSIDLCELFRTSFHPGLCIDTRFVVLVLFVHAVMYLPFSPFYEFRFASECHSVFIRSSALVAWANSRWSVDSWKYFSCHCLHCLKNCRVV